jgi:hypothetical protein
LRLAVTPEQQWLAPRLLRVSLRGPVYPAHQLRVSIPFLLQPKPGRPLALVSDGRLQALVVSGAVEEDGVQQLQTVRDETWPYAIFLH